MPEEFDRYVEDYSEQVMSAVGVGGQEHAFFLQVKADRLVDLAERHLGPAREQRILDVGCGVGMMACRLVDRFRDLAGVDIAADAVKRARQNVPGGQFQHYQPGRLPFDDGQFDLTFACCVMHHVPPAQWEAFTAEMARVTRPGGLVVVLEHNPLNPVTRRIVSRCAFDRDAVLLRARKAAKLLRGAGAEIVDRRYILFTPFSNAAARLLDRSLRWLPLGAQYCVAGRVAGSHQRS